MVCTKWRLVFISPWNTRLRSRLRNWRSVLSRCSELLPVARRRARPTRSDRRGEGNAGEGDRDRAGLIRHVCPARAVDAAGGPRAYARRFAQGRMAGLRRTTNAGYLVPPHERPVPSIGVQQRRRRLKAPSVLVIAVATVVFDWNDRVIVAVVEIPRRGRLVIDRCAVIDARWREAHPPIFGRRWCLRYYRCRYPSRCPASRRTASTPRS